MNPTLDSKKIEGRGYHNNWLSESNLLPHQFCIPIRLASCNIADFSNAIKLLIRQMIFHEMIS